MPQYVRRPIARPVSHTKEYNFGILFMIAAILIMIFVWDITWYWAIGIGFLAAFDFKVTTTNTYR